MLRHRRLGDPELGLHDGADLAGRLLAVCEQFQDPAPHWITEDIERMHAHIISALPYIRTWQRMVSPRSGRTPQLRLRRVLG
jgi:hypothetical protein